MISVGQEVTIAADAVEGKEFTGTVTKVSIVGTTSNGVTAYPITVRIDDTDSLLPGMNVDAEIVVESVTDVLAVPVDAVVRNNMVLVQSDESGEATGDATSAEGEASVAADSSLPEGFTYVEVTLGVNNDDYIEITSGLEEGDTIAIATVDTDTGETTTTTGLMVGGVTGGGGGDFSGGSGPPSGGGGGGPMGG
jgi:HlyD family secretion protein